MDARSGFGGMVLIGLMMLLLVGGLVGLGIWQGIEDARASKAADDARRETMRLWQIQAQEDAETERLQAKLDAQLAEQKAKYEQELQRVQAELDRAYAYQLLFEHNLVLLAQAQSGGTPEQMTAILEELGQESFGDWWGDWLIVLISSMLLMSGVLWVYGWRKKGARVHENYRARHRNV